MNKCAHSDRGVEWVREVGKRKKMSGMRNLGLWRVGRRRGSWNYCVCIGEKEDDWFHRETGCDDRVLEVGTQIVCRIDVDKNDWITLLDMHVQSGKYCTTTAISEC